MRLDHHVSIRGKPFTLHQNVHNSVYYSVYFEIRGKTFAVQGKTVKVLSLEPLILYYTVHALVHYKINALYTYTYICMATIVH